MDALAAARAVSPVAGAGNFSLAMCIFCTFRVPK